jgi:5-methylcytosine-specific restriction endonuclease McrA
MKNPRITAKERGLIKGSLRRVFSRSELRKEALNATRIDHKDPNRPRVTKWSWCTECGIIEPTYLIEIDHVKPVQNPGETLDDLTVDELVDRIWCELINLRAVCKPCHKEKTKAENQERARLRKIKKGNL